ncbi:uncharacterized protein METZ01_LOCUS43232, partial [marine metagenome]
MPIISSFLQRSSLLNNARRVLAEPLGLLGVVLVGTIVISALFAD